MHATVCWRPGIPPSFRWLSPGPSSVIWRFAVRGWVRVWHINDDIFWTEHIFAISKKAMCFAWTVDRFWDQYHPMCISVPHGDFGQRRSESYSLGTDTDVDIRIIQTQPFLQFQNHTELTTFWRIYAKSHLVLRLCIFHHLFFFCKTAKYFSAHLLYSSWFFWQLAHNDMDFFV